MGGAGTPLMTSCSKVRPPPGLGVQPAVHVEIDYNNFVFNLADKDIFTSTQDVANGTDTTYCDASCTAGPSTREASSGTDTTYRDASCIAGSWSSLSDPICGNGASFFYCDKAFGNNNDVTLSSNGMARQSTPTTNLKPTPPMGKQPDSDVRGYSNNKNNSNNRS